MSSLDNDVVIYKEGNPSILQFKVLLLYPHLKHAYTATKEKDYRTHNKEGISTNYPEAIKNYDKLADLIGASHNLLKPNICHSANVLAVTAPTNKNLEYAYPDENDGLITDLNDISLLSTSADCTSFLLYDPAKDVIGNLHAGWVGTTKKIIVNAIEKMVNTYNSQPKDIIVCICPSIRGCHFEVDKDVYDIFKKTYPEYQDCITYHPPKWHIDLVEINKRLMYQIGILKENIYDSNICTVCHGNEINSYRYDREKFKLNCAIIGKK